MAVLYLGNSINFWMEALVKWLWVRTHVQEVVGLNPSDVYFFALICCKNCIVCLKRPKINGKEAGVGPIFLKKLQRQKERATLSDTDRERGCENAAK